ncbi:hypothetical protein [Streptomyces sp. NBC_00069]|uniref:hypothetical protein n=1 Tax=Streptomyces sp. NBC_00069 TaxID=2975639 RepID=UPI0032471B61
MQLFFTNKRKVGEVAGLSHVQLTDLFERRRIPAGTPILLDSAMCRQECRKLQDQVDAAATVIAALLAENAAFREQLAKRSAAVIPLDRAPRHP